MPGAARCLALVFVVAVAASVATFGVAAGQSDPFGIDVPLTSAQGVAGSVIELVSVPVPSELVGQTCPTSFESENNGSVRQGSDLILSSGASSLELLNVEGSSPLVLTTTGPLTLGPTLTVSVRLGPEGEFSGGGAAGTVTCAAPPTTTTTTTTTTSTTAPAPPEICQYTVAPVRLPPSGGTVTVAGTAPRDAEVRVFVGGILQASTHTSATDGSFAVAFFLSRTSEIGVSVDDHPALGCGVDAVSQAAVPGGAQGSTPGGTGSNSGLPRTGGAAVAISAVIGLALALLGAGLVMAARRHDGVRRGS